MKTKLHIIKKDANYPILIEWLIDNNVYDSTHMEWTTKQVAENHVKMVVESDCFEQIDCCGLPDGLIGWFLIGLIARIMRNFWPALTPQPEVKLCEERTGGS